MPFVSPIADPIAQGSTLSKCEKLLKKAASSKAVTRGVPEVLRALRKDQKGMVFLAADVFPVDVLSAIPGMCEEKRVYYAWIPTRQSLGDAVRTKKPTSVAFVAMPDSGAEYEPYFEEARKLVKSSHPYM